MRVCVLPGNLGLNGALPTLNLVIQQQQHQEPEKVKSDVNVASCEPADTEPSETTAETLLTLSPDQEMNRECKGRRPLGEAFLRVGAIITEFNISGYGLAR